MFQNVFKSIFGFPSVHSNLPNWKQNKLIAKSFFFCFFAPGTTDLIAKRFWAAAKLRSSVRSSDENLSGPICSGANSEPRSDGKMMYYILERRTECARRALREQWNTSPNRRKKNRTNANTRTCGREKSAKGKCGHSSFRAENRFTANFGPGAETGPIRRHVSSRPPLPKEQKKREKREKREKNLSDGSQVVPTAARPTAQVAHVTNALTTLSAKNPGANNAAGHFASVPKELSFR